MNILRRLQYRFFPNENQRSWKNASLYDYYGLSFKGAKRKRPQTLELCFIVVALIATAVLLFSICGCIPGKKGFTFSATADWRDCPRSSTDTVKEVN